MKTILRQLNNGALTHLAFCLGVLKDDQAAGEEELIKMVSDYCSDYRLSWSDLLARFTFLQRPDARKELMTAPAGQTGTSRANSRTKRLSPLRDTNPVSDLDAPIEGLSSSSSPVVSNVPFAYAIAALRVDVQYHQRELAASTDKDDQEFNRFVIKQLEDAIAVLQEEGTILTKEVIPK